jgi:hypothetical protein
MSFLISHPEGYTFVSPDEVPEDFVVKCYSIEKTNTSLDEIVNSDLLYDKSNWHIEYWEVDYDLPNKSIVGLVRYTRFKTFEEAAIMCELLGLKRVKCKWLGYPLAKVGNHWIMSGISPQGIYIPEEGYDEFAERFYRKNLGEHYEEFMNMFPAWRPKTKKSI